MVLFDKVFWEQHKHLVVKPIVEVHEVTKFVVAVSDDCHCVFLNNDLDCVVADLLL